MEFDCVFKKTKSGKLDLFGEGISASREAVALCSREQAKLNIGKSGQSKQWGVWDTCQDYVPQRTTALLRGKKINTLIQCKPSRVYLQYKTAEGY